MSPELQGRSKTASKLARILLSLVVFLPIPVAISIVFFIVSSGGNEYPEAYLSLHTNLSTALFPVYGR